MNEPRPASENKMGTMPVPKLLFTMSIPMVISMLVQALYNVVDSVFVAKLSEDALNAVSLAFPVQNLMISVAVGTGVGINALLSKSLGENRQARANAAAMNGLFLSVVSCLVFVLLGLTCSRGFFLMQTGQQAIVDYGAAYMFIVSVLSGGMFLQITFDRVLQATGRTVYTLFTQAVGAVINIILDPILIFGLFGLPRMEVAGAALATVAVMAVRVLLMVLIDGLFYGWYWSWGGFVTSVLGLAVTGGGLWVLMYLDGQQALVGKSADQLRQLGYDLSDAMKELRFTGGNQNTSGQEGARPQYQSASADYGAAAARGRRPGAPRGAGRRPRPGCRPPRCAPPPR